MLTEPAGTAAAMHIEHPDHECAGFLRLNHIMRREYARHIPDFEILLNMRQCLRKTFVASRQVVHNIGGKHRVHEADLGGRPGDHSIVMRAATHCDIGAAIGLAGDQGNLRYRGQTGRVHEIHNLARRAAALYTIDKGKSLRKSYENPAIEELYDKFLGVLGLEKSHTLLHTHYQGKLPRGIR